MCQLILYFSFAAFIYINFCSYTLRNENVTSSWIHGGKQEVVVLKPCTVAHTYNPNLWEAKVQGSHEPRSLRLAWALQGDPVSIKKNKNWPGMESHASGPSYLGGWSEMITWVHAQTTALQPGQESKTLSKKKQWVLRIFFWKITNDTIRYTLGTHSLRRIYVEILHSN